jgi:hypothetical protein
LALSDLEGEFDAAVALLRANQVIDQDLHWSYGNGQVVLLGDQVDRGKNVVPLLWLIYRLEAEAQAAGGHVHYVLGNHEYYLLEGATKSLADKYFGTLNLIGTSHGELWSKDTALGSWLRSKPVIVQIGDTLFMHGGVSAKVLDTGVNLERVDAIAAQFFGLPRREVKDPTALILLVDAAGIPSDRSLAMDLAEAKKADSTHVDRVLKHFNVRRLAIGHTLATHVGHDYDGRVLRTDVPHAQGTNEAILFAEGQVFAVDRSGQRQALAAVVPLTE